MKTVSTKLDKQTFEKFQEMCNYDGQCISEQLREIIKMNIDAYEEGLDMEREESEIIEPVFDPPRSVAHGQILDDDGNVVGTF